MVSVWLWPHKALEWRCLLGNLGSIHIIKDFPLNFFLLYDNTGNIMVSGKNQLPF